ncbi:hypothetical protein HanPI659440_Chr00c01g0704261 [Helianthus annuus]|nr:hypothetical protein HanPI659440_Chr00c01g0704261 [Helianthus annuus]
MHCSILNARCSILNDFSHSLLFVFIVRLLFYGNYRFFSVQLLVVLIMGDNSNDEVLEISRDQFVQKVDAALRKDYGFFFSHEVPNVHQVILYFYKCIFLNKINLILSNNR